jgi:hypothetical protein
MRHSSLERKVGYIRGNAQLVMGSTMKSVRKKMIRWGTKRNAKKITGGGNSNLRKKFIIKSITPASGHRKRLSGIVNLLIGT